MRHLRSGRLYSDLDAFQSDLLLRDFIQDSGRSEQFYTYVELVESGFGREKAVYAARKRPIIETLPAFK